MILNRNDPLIYAGDFNSNNGPLKINDLIFCRNSTAFEIPKALLHKQKDISVRKNLRNLQVG